MKTTINNEAITKAVTEKATEVCNDILGADSKIPQTANIAINVSMSYGDINCDISCDVHADNAAYRNKQHNKNHSRRNRNKNNVTNNKHFSDNKQRTFIMLADIDDERKCIDDYLIGGCTHTGILDVEYVVNHPEQYDHTDVLENGKRTTMSGAVYRLHDVAREFDNSISSDMSQMLRKLDELMRNSKLGFIIRFNKSDETKLSAKCIIKDKDTRSIHYCGEKFEHETLWSFVNRMIKV